MKINLNSPDGNIFVLLAKIHNLMVEANICKEEINKWQKEVLTHKTYGEMINAVKVKCKELSKLLNEEIEIISTEEYEMEV